MSRSFGNHNIDNSSHEGLGTSVGDGGFQDPMVQSLKLKKGSQKACTKHKTFKTLNP